VPVQLARIVEAPDFDPADYASLESIVCCGSPLAPALKRKARDALGCNLIELYGLTEGLITTLAPEEFDRKLDSVGRPVPGQKLLILDGGDRPIPPGLAGEIVGFGPLMMRGYHNRPDANDEATWVHPDGTRWLRTGDIGRVDDDGFLYLVDRKKDLILSGGQNVYPADIETVLIQHPAVAEVAVIGVSSEKWGESPLALVVRRACSTVEASALADWTNARVGRQQRVAGIVFVDELPRNPNGKVLKRDLRRQFADYRV
jgi:acyl-CoA synthetase (AMP-forming)/AMP-acid ligase II